MIVVSVLARELADCIVVAVLARELADCIVVAVLTREVCGPTLAGGAVWWRCARGQLHEQFWPLSAPHLQAGGENWTTLFPHEI